MKKESRIRRKLIIKIITKNYQHKKKYTKKT